MLDLTKLVPAGEIKVNSQKANMPVEEQAFADRGQNVDTQSDDTSHVTAEEKETQNAVPFYKLFVFSDWWDKILMLIGTIGAIGNGLNPPLMAFLFGDLADAFGGTQNDKVVAVVSKVKKIL